MAEKVKLTKITSGYLPPEDGPFKCGNCIYFDKPESCDLVEGYIDFDGCCNLYIKDEEVKKPEKESNYIFDEEDNNPGYY